MKVCVTGVNEAAWACGQVLKSTSAELTSITSQCNWINREIVVFIFCRLSSSACAAVCDCVKALRTALIGIFELNSLLKTNKTKPKQRFPYSLSEHELRGSCIVFSKNIVTLFRVHNICRTCSCFARLRACHPLYFSCSSRRKEFFFLSENQQ